MQFSLFEVFMACGVPVIAFMFSKIWSMDNEIKEVKSDVKWLIKYHEEKEASSSSLFK